MTNIVTKEGSRFDDYDFKECMKYAPFKLEDIKEIIACVPGEADGASWHYICQLKDGTYGYVTGWCDYTGWGCGESGGGNIGTLDDVLAKVTDEKIRETLNEQIAGKQPYGLITHTP